MRVKKLLSALLLVLIVCVGSICYRQNVEAAGNYYAQVNKGTNVVTIFNNAGTPVTAFTCSAGQATPLGTFYTSNKYVWHVLDGNVYGQYCTRINGGVLFHSVWYYAQDKSTQSYAQYNKLGTLASHGCVRLTVAASKWIYDNCPSGMKVVIINGSSANDPLGKPTTIKVNPNQKMGWDPTDPDPVNPYARSFPTIDVSGVPRQIQLGSGFWPYNGVSAHDSLGNDITSSIQVSGGVDANRLGNYTITYSVTDALGRTASASVTISVVDGSQPTITGVKSLRTVEYKGKRTLLAGVRAKNGAGADLTSSIRVEVFEPKAKTGKVYRKPVYQFKKLGTYRVRYSVTNPNNGRTATAVGKYKVVDTKKPVITGAPLTKTYNYKQQVNLRKGVKAALVSGRNLTSKIDIYVMLPGTKVYHKLSVDKSKAYKFARTGTYYVKYVAVNPNSKKLALKKTKVTVVDKKAPVITGMKEREKEAEYLSTVNLRKGMKAALVSGKDMTAKIKVEIFKPGTDAYITLSQKRSTSYTFYRVGRYKVRYTCVNPTSKKVATKTMYYNVSDTQAPVITGDMSDLNVTVMATKDLLDQVSARMVSKTDVTDQIQVEVRLPETEEYVVLTKEQANAYVFEQEGTYMIRYSCANPVSKKMSVAERKVIVTQEQTQEPPAEADVTMQTPDQEMR